MMDHRIESSKGKNGISNGKGAVQSSLAWSWPSSVGSSNSNSRSCDRFNLQKQILLGFALLLAFTINAMRSSSQLSKQVAVQQKLLSAGGDLPEMAKAGLQSLGHVDDAAGGSSDTSAAAVAAGAPVIPSPTKATSTTTTTTTTTSTTSSTKKATTTTTTTTTPSTTTTTTTTTSKAKAKMDKNDGAKALPPPPPSSSSQIPPWNNGNTRILFGIMSYYDKHNAETKRREAIRQTWLSLENENVHFCALSDIVFDKTQSIDNCTIIYTFVVTNGNITDPNRTILVDDKYTHYNQIGYPELDQRREFAHSRLPTNSTKRPVHSNITDITVLNIYENGKQGKSTTWFNYASMIIKQHNLPIQFIVKTDSDTMLYPNPFHKWFHYKYDKEIAGPFQKYTEQFSQPPNGDKQISSSAKTKPFMVFGGTPLTKSNCGWPEYQTCRLMICPIFMGGAFYFVSVDMASYIASNDCPRKQVFIPHEDVNMGNLVWSYVNKIHPNNNFTTVDEQSDVVYVRSHGGAYGGIWRHPIKSPERMIRLWPGHVNVSYIIKPGH
mmetsp:Transcript_660/g.1611  ORF Transcript_660/g.1611 Transcript_660/m.1611 type:complete len:550 (+) Transcript_660:67-1716(+)